MKLTVEEHRETIKRYAHIKPAPRWGSVRCAVRLSGSARTCTRAKGHRGPHVAHGSLRNVVAVWDDGVEGGRLSEGQEGSRRALARKDLRSGRTLEALGAWARRVARNPEQFVEESLLLIFALAMAGFVIDWALRIIGWR